MGCQFSVRIYQGQVLKDRGSESPPTEEEIGNGRLEDWKGGRGMDGRKMGRAEEGWMEEGWMEDGWMEDGWMEEGWMEEG